MDTMLTLMLIFMLETGIALLLMLVGIVGLSRETVRIYERTDFPRIWIDLVLGLLLALPQILYVICVYSDVLVSSSNLGHVFDGLAFFFFLLPGLAALVRPIKFDKSPAMYEIPLLFAICVSYLFLSFYDKTTLRLGSISILLIFPMFCYDLFRMKELGNYDVPQDDKRPLRQVMKFVAGWTVLYCGGWVYLHFLYDVALVTIADSLVLNCWQVCLYYLPYICLASMILRYGLPVTMFVRANVIRLVVCLSLVLPVDMLQRRVMYGDLSSGILLWDVFVLGVLWFLVARVKVLTAKIGCVLLLLYLIHVYRLIG